MLLCPNKFGVCVCAMVVSSEVDAGDYSPNETPLMQTLSIVLGCHSTSRISNIFQTYPRISIFSKSSVISCDVISLYIIYIHVYIRIYIYYIYTRIYTYIYINHMFNVTVTKLVSGAVYVGRCSTCWVPSCSTPSPMCRRCRRQRWFIRSTRIDMCAMVKTRRIDEDGHRSISRDLEWPIYGFPGMACWYISFDHGTCDGSSCRWLK